MQNSIVFTITGSDRPGVVDTVTEILLAHGGNVEASRMARLGGVFAMLLMVSLPIDRSSDLPFINEKLVEHGFQITSSLTERAYGKRYPGWLPFQIEVKGADHEGIIHQVAHYLSKCGINIESMDTRVVPAPMSGTPIFIMTSLVYVPPELLDKDWIDELEDEANSLEVDLKVESVNM